MVKPEDVIAGARDIRPHLPDLVGPGWEELDRLLGDLLTRAEAGQAVDTEILEALRRHDRTRAWLRERLGVARLGEAERAWRQVPGAPEPIGMSRYVCPGGDYTWYRHSVGVPIPLCPTHKVRLVAAGTQ